MTARSLDVGMLPQGVYTIQLQGSRTVATTRFVVRK
jgi:hypothetical protein